MGFIYKQTKNRGVKTPAFCFKEILKWTVKTICSSILKRANGRGKDLYIGVLCFFGFVVFNG